MVILTIYKGLDFVVKKIDPAEAASRTDERPRGKLPLDRRLQGFAGQLSVDIG